MCSAPQMPVDTTAQQVADQTATQQANVSAGRNAIDSAFAPFNDDYFNNYGQTYENYYNPQVDQQYTQAQQKETYDDARKGVLNSTPAITDAGKLDDSYLQQRQQVASNATGAVNDLKNDVQTQKQTLYNANAAAADPNAAAASAAAATGTIPSTPQYSALGDLFSSLVNTGAGYVAGQNQSALYPTRASVGSALPTASGSGSVVR